jgi:Mn-dependent DtxR family transcriptional regulator
MCHDRAGSDSFSLTHESFAAFLGVSRPTVSLIARTLQAAGLISYKRGRISIESREGLEEASCECYGIIRRRYEECLLQPGS